MPVSALVIAALVPLAHGLASQTSVERRYCSVGLAVPQMRYAVATMTTDADYKALLYKVIFGGNDGLIIEWVSENPITDLSNHPSMLELPALTFPLETTFPIKVDIALDERPVWSFKFWSRTTHVTVIPDGNIDPNKKPYDLHGIDIKMVGADLQRFYKAQGMKVVAQSADLKLRNSFLVIQPDWIVAATALKVATAQLEADRVAHKCAPPPTPVF